MAAHSSAVATHTPVKPIKHVIYTGNRTKLLNLKDCLATSTGAIDHRLRAMLGRQAEAEGGKVRWRASKAKG